MKKEKKNIIEKVQYTLFRAVGCADWFMGLKRCPKLLPKWFWSVKTLWRDSSTGELLTLGYKSWYSLFWRIDEVNLYLLWSCENIFWNKLARERPPKVCIQLFQLLYISFYEVILQRNEYIETSKTYCYKNHLNNSK